MSQPWQGIGDKSGLRVSKMTLENDFAGRDPGRSSSHPQSSRATFRDLFCETYQCLAEEFRDTVFWRCLYPGAIPLARLIWHEAHDYRSFRGAARGERSQCVRNGSFHSW